MSTGGDEDLETEDSDDKDSENGHSEEKDFEHKDSEGKDFEDEHSEGEVFEAADVEVDEPVGADFKPHALESQPPPVEAEVAAAPAQDPVAFEQTVEPAPAQPAG